MYDIYFACALGPARKNARVMALYDFLARMIREKGYSIYMPHEELLTNADPKAVYTHSMQHVENSRALILYAGWPSLGASMEFQRAVHIGNPTIVLAEEKVSIENSVLAEATVIIKFSSGERLKEQLYEVLGLVIESSIS